MVVQFPFTKSVCGNLRKMVKKQQFDKTAKKSEVKNSSSKNIFLKTMHIFHCF